MTRPPLMVVATVLVAITALGCSRRLTTGNNASELAAEIVDGGIKALEQETSSEWDRLEDRLAKLFSDPSRDADEAVVILMSFYLGEHTGEELYQNLLDRGPKMIPLIRRYIDEPPASLLARYPRRVQLERATTERLLKEALEILEFQAGARRIYEVSIKTAPHEKQVGDCIVKLLDFAKLELNEPFTEAGESYRGAPVLRARIGEAGDLDDVQLLSSSGIRQLDTLLVNQARQWKYAPRKGCGSVHSNVVITIDWTKAE